MFDESAFENVFHFLEGSVCSDQCSLFCLSCSYFFHQVQLIPEQMDTTYQQYMYTQSSNIFNPAGASYDPPASLVVPMATRTSKPLEEINIGALKKILQDR